MKTFPILTSLAIVMGMHNRASAESGDQFLDGIGETALISRYVFDGNFADWSRNALTASAVGNGSAFADDGKFGKVLSLPGGADGAFVQMPVSAIGDAVSFSVTGWVKVGAETPGQWFFDLGTDANHHLGLIAMGARREDGCAIRFSSGNGEQGPSTFRPQAGEWVHVAVVLDEAKKTLSLYAGGTLAGRLSDMENSIASLAGKQPRLFLGRSVADGGPRLGGQLHDVRFYRIALSDGQVAAIHHNSISDQKITTNENDVRTESYRENHPQLLHGDLESVRDIEATTEVGRLPRLPREIAGTYKHGAKGPAVRVIWPSPKDNSTVAKPGTHVVTGRIPGTSFEPKAKVTVVEASMPEKAPGLSLEPFPLSRVMLIPDEDGKPTLFMKHRDKFLAGLAATNPDRFLYVFRNAFGQPQPPGTEALGVWDSQTTRLRGHATGHYLSALAQAYAGASHDPELRAVFSNKMDRMIDALHTLSRMSGRAAMPGGPSNADPAKVPPGPGRNGFDSDLSENGIRTDYWNWGAGFISGYPPDQFIMLENGAAYGTGNHQIWAPYYTLHKILAGLLDCHEAGGNPKALEVARDMALWVHARLSQVPRETRTKMWSSYIAGEYGGMNEVLARLFRITGDKRFLETAKMFDNTNLFFGDASHSGGLAKNVDTIRGRHANQHIPQILGALETYRDTHEIPYYHVAENFWDICENSYMYSIGGVAGARNPNNAECFTAEPDSLFHNGLSEGGQNETCATYNLLKLGRELFRFSLDPKYMHYYERAIYNHILASVDEDNPGNTYHVPLNPGSRKSFGNADMDGFTCCNGTALESGTKLQDSIYFRSLDNSSLHVNLFVSSALDWKERGVKLIQTTNFPFADTSTLTIEGNGEFTLRVRVPLWADNGMSIQVNGERQQVEATQGTYAELRRDWKSGDKVELKIPMGFHLHALMDQPNIASIFHGPVLLAAEEPNARSTWRSVTLDTDHLEKSITGDRSSLHFQIGDTKLKPFFQFHDDFHSVYLNIKPDGSQKILDP